MIRNSNVTNEKHDVFMLSGGVDSVALLEQLIERRLVSNLLLLYVDIEKCNLVKAKKEKVAIQRCLKKLAKENPNANLTYDYREIQIDAKFYNDVLDRRLTEAMVYVGLNAASIHGSNRIFLGLIRGDSSLTTPAFELARNASKNYLTPIHAPLARVNKATVLAYVSPNLAKLTSVCEASSDKRYCGVCAKCIELYQAIYKAYFTYQELECLTGKIKRNLPFDVVLRKTIQLRRPGFNRLDPLDLTIKL